MEYIVNVHYNYLLKVKVNAKNEKEAKKLAKNIADESSEPLEFCDFINCEIESYKK